MKDKLPYLLGSSWRTQRMWLGCICFCLGSTPPDTGAPRPRSPCSWRRMPRCCHWGWMRMGNATTPALQPCRCCDRKRTRPCHRTRGGKCSPTDRWCWAGQSLCLPPTREPSCIEHPLKWTNSSILEHGNDIWHKNMSLGDHECISRGHY